MQSFARLCLELKFNLKWPIKDITLHAEHYSDSFRKHFSYIINTKFVATNFARRLNDL